MIIALLGLKVKVIDQGQTSKVEVKGRNAVGGSSIPNRGQFSSCRMCALSGLKGLLEIVEGGVR